VVDLLDTPKVVELSSNDELMEDLEEDLGTDPELGEYQVYHEVEHAESDASNSSFDSAKEPRDVSDLNYNPSSDL